MNAPRTITVKSFAALGAAVAAETNRRDVEAAQRLQRSAPLRRNRKPGRGPAVAVPTPVLGGVR